MRIDASKLDRQAAHELLKGCVAPRPIAWISTVSSEGVCNAAPYSCFTFVALEPPMVCFSVERKRDGTKKDTLRNVEETGEFVVNVVPEELAGAMNATAEDFPPWVSEFEKAGLTPVPGERVRAPRIAESPVNLECRVERIVEVGSNSLVISEVLLVHVRDDLYRDGTIDVGRLRPLARLAGNQYCRLGEVFELERPWLREVRQ
ncbi:MAG: flavin reductase family protein [Verrucomicrobiae bacterium]|nr:flavin reductase family protein [Verrucomicrobiae bacterium]